MIVKREEYLGKLRALKDKHIIKVVIGVRRSGKSTLLEMFRREILEGGATERQVQSYNFEDPEVGDDYLELYREIKEKLVEGEKNYIFLDEVQNVKEFEKLVDGLFILENTDVYITGSNAYFLSGELATYLSGRYIEIRMLPLAYKEYLEMRPEGNLDEYLQYGGMPQAVEMMNEGEGEWIDYMEGVYGTVMVKDVLARNGTVDAEAMNGIVRFLFDNVGNLVSSNSIANYLTSNGKKMDARKVEKIIGALHECFVLYPVQRYNIKGKELLKTRQKYYLVDTGFRKMLLGTTNEADRGRLLENIVYLELLRRRYQVWVGQTRGGKEVDFVARSAKGDIEYYQVAETILGEETREREYGALEDVKDNYAKFVLTRDGGRYDREGIKVLNVEDWLLGRE